MDKKYGSLFGETMESFDRAKICELVSVVTLHNLANAVGARNIDLYRNDGLAILKDATGPTAERTKKKVIRIFRAHGLKITADTNLAGNYSLDKTLNLKTGKILAVPQALRFPICAQSIQSPGRN